MLVNRHPKTKDMSKQITDYGIFSPPGEDGDRYNICGLIAGTMDYVTFGPAFPESEMRAAMKTIDDLVEQYGLPVDAEKIMQHFLEETETQQ